MHQTVENTAYCLNCTHQWPATWGLAKEPTLVCPKCKWRLSVPEEIVSSGWWASEEIVERFEGHSEVQEVTPDKLSDVGLRRKIVVAVGILLILASLLIILLVALGVIAA
jgi:hypothetical protein